MPTARNTRSLFKFYDERQWAEKFMDGQFMFRALSYFRDQEDAGVRGDGHEGMSVFRPRDGLVMTNHTQGTTSTLPDHALTTTVKQDEIFVFCLSRTMSDQHWTRFGATACVEVHDIAAFCARVQAAVAPGATFPGLTHRQRIGHRVDYYHPEQAKSPRWALPDRIAVSKLSDYAWQDEFRLVFSHTNALDFERVDARLVQGEVVTPPRALSHPFELLRAQSLRDLCTLHLHPT